MHIEVNGTRLWFDVEGPALVPDGAPRDAPDLYWPVITGFLRSVTVPAAAS